MAKWLNENIESNEKKAMKLMYYFGKNDLFFLLYFLMNRVDINEPWLYDRCVEVQEDHDNTLDLWSRYHYKSTISTIGQTIRDILNYPERSNVIFSYTGGLARKYVREIMMILEGNMLLKMLYPAEAGEALFLDPRKQSPKWSEQDGFVVNRKSTAKEMTCEGHALIEQPSGPHYDNRIYEDCVTKESVWTPEQIAKTQEAFERSHALKSRYGTMRITGTIYHFADLYSVLMKQGIYKLRFYPAEDESGKPATFLSKEELVDIKKTMGRDAWASQMMLNPVASDKKTFEISWIKYYGELPHNVNLYILVDPADDKKKKSDYTVMGVIAVDSFRNFYLADMIRDKLNLGERWTALRNLVTKWRNKKFDIMGVGYEKYGKDAETYYMREKMIQDKVIFSITELGGNVPKIERIKELQAPFQNGKFWLPRVLEYIDIKGIKHDLITELIQDEYIQIPFAMHDDQMDMMARIMDPDMLVVYPSSGKSEEIKIPDGNMWFDMVKRGGNEITWEAL